MEASDYCYQNFANYFGKDYFQGSGKHLVVGYYEIDFAHYYALSSEQDFATDYFPDSVPGYFEVFDYCFRNFANYFVKDYSQDSEKPHAEGLYEIDFAHYSALSFVQEFAEY